MSTPDLSPLVKGALSLVLFSIATGQYPVLERWARRQALTAVTWREPLPYFFGEPRGSKPISHSVAHAKATRKGATIKVRIAVR